MTWKKLNPLFKIWDTDRLSIGVLRKAKAVKMEADRVSTAWTHLAKFNFASFRLFKAKAPRVKTVHIFQNNLLILAFILNVRFFYIVLNLIKIQNIKTWHKIIFYQSVLNLLFADYKTCFLTNNENLKSLFNPLTTGKGYFWPTCFLTLWKIELAVIFQKYEQ